MVECKRRRKCSSFRSFAKIVMDSRLSPLLDITSTLVVSTSILCLIRRGSRFGKGRTYINHAENTPETVGVAASAIFT